MVYSTISSFDFTSAEALLLGGLMLVFSLVRPF